MKPNKQDIAFAKAMIPHHQAAIDMARQQLSKGRDAQMKKVATAVIAAQSKEITFLRNWLKAAGQSAPASTTSNM